MKSGLQAWSGLLMRVVDVGIAAALLRTVAHVVPWAWWRSQASIFQDALTSARAATEELKAEVRQMREDHAADMAALRVRYERELAALRADVNECKRDRDDLRCTNERLLAEVQRNFEAMKRLPGRLDEVAANKEFLQAISVALNVPQKGTDDGK